MAFLMQLCGIYFGKYDTPLSRSYYVGDEMNHPADAVLAVFLNVVPVSIKTLQCRLSCKHLYRFYFSRKKKKNIKTKQIRHNTCESDTESD